MNLKILTESRVKICKVKLCNMQCKLSLSNFTVFINTLSSLTMTTRCLAIAGHQILTEWNCSIFGN